MFQFEKEAKRGLPMPEGLSPTEIACYQAIACLADRSRMGAIEPDAARAEFGQIMRAFDRQVQREQRLDEREKHHAEFRANVEKALREYGTNRTPEMADQLWEVVSGLKRGI